MIDEIRVLPECEGDTLWIWFLLKQKTEHVKGCDNVIIKINKSRENELRIGIVDNDKRKSSTYSNFGKIIKTSDGVKLVQKLNTKHFLIIVDPAIEKWLLRMAEVSKIKHSYTFNSLQKDMKSEKVENNNRVKQFMNTIYQKNPPGVSAFKNWLTSLLKNGKV